MFLALIKLLLRNGLSCDECATSTWLMHTRYASYVYGMDINPFCDKYTCQGYYVEKQHTTCTFTVYCHVSSIKILPIVCGHCKLLSDPPSYFHSHILANSKKIMSTPCSAINYSQQHIFSMLGPPIALVSTMEAHSSLLTAFCRQPSSPVDPSIHLPAVSIYVFHFFYFPLVYSQKYFLNCPSPIHSYYMSNPIHSNLFSLISALVPWGQCDPILL